MGVPVPFAELENPQSLNLYSYVGNNPLSRTDPDGHDYIICPTGGQCVTLTNQQYLAALGGNNPGINLPQFGDSGTITCGGQACGTAEYKDQGAVEDLSGGQLLGIAGGKALESLGLFDRIGSAIGSLFGKEAGNVAGNAAGGGAKMLLTDGTKQAAKAVVDGMADGAQKASVKRAVAGAISRDSISIAEHADGSITVTKVRPGADGFQAIVKNVDPSGASVTIQGAYNAQGDLVHLDPKN